MASDLFCLFLAMLLALFISDIQFNSISAGQFFNLLWTPLICSFTFWYFGVYSSVVRYIDLSVILILARAIFILGLFTILSKLIYGYFITLLLSQVPKSLINLEGWLVGITLFTLLTISSRLIAHYYLFDRESEKRIIIYGAGSAGIQLANALRVSTEMQPIAFLDANPSLQGTYIGDIKVLHPKSLERLVSRKKVDEVLIAMPSVSKPVLKRLLKEIEDYQIKVRILPGLAELAQGKVSVSELKEVEILDLLGRLEVDSNHQLMDRNVKDKVILITGAGGSIGSEISRQVASNGAKQVILLDSNEYSLYSIKNELELNMPDVEFYSLLANICDRNKINEIFRTFEVDTVYHAAAYKHVPLVEENPFQAVTNNIFGTKICAEVAIDNGVETFVLISTDKAVRPTNIMGATKRFAELVLQSLAHNQASRMTMVRFGNVIGSSGSAIPLFQKQIREGGPVTVTHPEVVRYFMSIPEAAELVIQAGAMGQGGDVFVLDMGEPVKILELAKRLINLSGMELIDQNNPDGDIEIKFTGLRPGEKLYEELLIGENASFTEHKRIFKAQEEFLPYEELDEYLKKIREAESSGDIITLKNILEEVVSGYRSDQEIVDVLYLQNKIKKN
tara:strand:+ start:8148 stop:10007 length:1860 start_codon:yes stop_codon:yes gene_type:complete